MKLGIFGDLHFTNRGPCRRIDENYFDTQLDKFNQGLDIFEEEECTHIFQVGDFFDAPTVSNYVISEIISLLKNRGIFIYCCYGQHDISGHSSYTLRRSPLKILESAGVIKIVDDDPVVLKNIFSSDGTFKRIVNVYGSSFGTDVPAVKEVNSYNILITHRMVGDRRLYPDQLLPSPVKFLKEHSDYDVILCGDYHYRFIEQVEKSYKRVIINPGCIMRKTANSFDLEHRPAVVVFDVELEEYKTIELNFKPVEEVFDLTMPVEKDNASLLKFIESLKKEDTSGVDWKNILLKVLTEKKSSQKVKDLIDELMAEFKEN